MKKFVMLFGILFISGFLFFIFFGCATQEEAVKEEEAEKPREEEVVEEEPSIEEPAKEEPAEEMAEEVETVEMIDSDDDGISDDKDRCPDTPYGIEVDASGCPPDSDGDGVYDYLDMCPDTAEGAAVDPFGCPKVLSKLREGVFKVVLEFDTDSARIRPVYYKKYAKDVEKLLMENPEVDLVKIEIKGHADSTGKKSYNHKLSERRANSVKRFIVEEFGVDSDMIEVSAFGSTRPIASNSTRAGRQRNRRVEVVIAVKNLRE